MTWERELFDLFEDLEQQAEALARAARDSEVVELARAEYSEVDLASRFHASETAAVELRLRGGLVVHGRLGRVGRGWLLVTADGDQEWIVNLGALLSVRGLAPGARQEQARPVTARLGLGSVLRGTAEAREVVTAVDVDGARHRGRLVRVGSDFLELSGEEAGLRLVPFGALAAVRRG